MFWEYDARIGRRWNLDPKPDPSISLYATFSLNPIWYSDLLGDTTKAGTWMRENLPGLIAAPLGGLTDLGGGLGNAIAGAFTLDKSKAKKGMLDAGAGALSIVGLADVTKKWEGGPTGGKLPVTLKQELLDVRSQVPGDAWKNGMHAWHAGSNAALANKLGPVGFVFAQIGGVFHESPLDFNSFKAEQLYQGTVNHIMDSGTDIITNVFGGIVGLVLPKKLAVKVAIKLGNQIPGPGETDPHFGGNGPMYDIPNYTHTGDWKRTNVKTSDAWFEQPSF